MNDNIAINKLSKYIEENLRVSDQTTINFIDPRGHIPRLNSKQNQVIFGRRGSGKSLLVRTLNKNNYDSIFVKINIEDFKDVSFPNSILQVLINFFKQLDKRIDNHSSWYEFSKSSRGRKVLKKVRSKIKEFQSQLLLPDTYDESIKKTGADKSGAAAKVSGAGAELSASGETNSSTETQKSLQINKLDNLRNELTDLKELVIEISNFLDNKYMFLVLDDFYFIKKSDQAKFVDFFHRLSKDTPIFLKVATIKHRSALYSDVSGIISGIQIGHDAQPIELDYTLDQFQALSNFMWDLLRQANSNSNAGVDLKALISDNAFKQLCLASGGVPRDFLALFIKLCNNVISGKAPITKTDVNEIAIENYPNKLENFKRDSAEERDLLEYYLKFLRNFMLTEKSTNICLVCNNDIGGYSQIKQAIKELVDLRVLHIVDTNTSSAPSDGKRYSAYIIDIGLYPNSKPRNFKQIEPGITDTAGRKDHIRSAPKVNLEQFKIYIDGLNLTHQLRETE